ncbi:hypothetical protein [Lactiplantibacillus daowaiensis]|uniref:Integral membrane protein n=1 Tax=Lactiplantibacillus daowaiensis TaxID=2559918 RepID=A0ABW1S2U9_9LACO|nr:hypothetical protein [Lactiplantibacillus daowaiensis]
MRGKLNNVLTDYIWGLPGYLVGIWLITINVSQLFSYYLLIGWLTISFFICYPFVLSLRPTWRVVKWVKRYHDIKTARLEQDIQLANQSANGNQPFQSQDLANLARLMGTWVVRSLIIVSALPLGIILLFLTPKSVS